MISQANRFKLLFRRDENEGIPDIQNEKITEKTRLFL
jgi:hypothetical protein